MSGWKQKHITAQSTIKKSCFQKEIVESAFEFQASNKNLVNKKVRSTLYTLKFKYHSKVNKNLTLLVLLLFGEVLSF